MTSYLSLMSNWLKLIPALAVLAGAAALALSSLHAPLYA